MVREKTEIGSQKSADRIAPAYEELQLRNIEPQNKELRMSKEYPRTN